MRFKLAALLLAVSASNLSAQNINSAADPALAGATTITFSGETLGQYSAFTTGGVKFTASNPATLYITNAYAGDYNTTGTHLANTYDNGFNSLRMDFLGGPVSAFGFNYGAADLQWTLSAYDAANMLIGSRVVPSAHESNGAFFGLTTGSSNIAYATLVSSGSGDYVMIDNFMYTGTTVTPEPGSVALVAAGLAGVAGIARRRRVRA